LANDDRKCLLNFAQCLLRQLLQIPRPVAQDTLTIGDLVLQRAFTRAQLVGRKPATFIAKALLFIAPALLFALHIFIQLGAAAFDFLAHLVEGSGNALDFRHIHYANQGRGRGRAGGQRGRGLLLSGALLLLRWLRRALALRLPLPLGLARHKPARLVLRRSHHGKGEQSGKDKANHGAIIPC